MAILNIASQQSFTSIKISLERLQKDISQAKAVQQSQNYRRWSKPATLNIEYQNASSR
ncbi:Hypothetical protein P9303_25551 [Prochlorococcus marinus str. MIT 9303]|uniref:Uncharacterized protein n=1 Tax=Prochlorococcus marinus (strain MIT 9303) TaxID=59922 RepID=A2CCS6_PROM3|nr:Hypothetical protein P9303_25551 [Prochlorococcus marinus str. MIT 9303]